MRAANDDSATEADTNTTAFVIGQCVACVFKTISTSDLHTRKAVHNVGELLDAYRFPGSKIENRVACEQFLEGFKTAFVEGMFDH